MKNQLADDLGTLRAANMEAIARQYNAMAKTLIKIQKFAIEWDLVVYPHIYSVAEKALRRFAKGEKKWNIRK